MSKAETKEFAAVGKSVVEHGVMVMLRRDDALKLFGAVIAANVVTYTIIEKYKKRQAKKFKQINKA